MKRDVLVPLIKVFLIITIAILVLPRLAGFHHIPELVLFFSIVIIAPLIYSFFSGPYDNEEEDYGVAVTNNIQDTCWFYAGEMSNFYKVILEPAPEGTYIFIYNSAKSKFAEKDYLQDDLIDAKRFCEQELGLSKDNWKEDTSITRLMG